MTMPLADLRVEAVDENATRDVLRDYVRGLSAHYSKEALEAFETGVLSLVRPRSTAPPTFARVAHNNAFYLALLLERYRVGDASPPAPPWLAEVPLLTRLVSDGRAEVVTIDRVLLPLPNTLSREKPFQSKA